MLGLLSGIASAGVAGGLGILGQNQANQFNAQEAEKARQWAKEMSNTAHQRQVQDLKAAGLNPILSAGGGGGAPSYSASQTAPAQNSQLNTAQAGLQAMQLQMQQELNNSAIEVNKSQASNIDADTATKLAKLPKEETKAELWDNLHGIAKDVADIAPKTLKETSNLIGRGLDWAGEKWNDTKAWWKQSSAGRLFN